jgi:hypothetical protein
MGAAHDEVTRLMVRIERIVAAFIVVFIVFNGFWFSAGCLFQRWNRLDETWIIGFNSDNPHALKTLEVFDFSKCVL